MQAACQGTSRQDAQAGAAADQRERSDLSTVHVLQAGLPGPTGNRASVVLQAAQIGAEWEDAGTKRQKLGGQAGHRVVLLRLERHGAAQVRAAARGHGTQVGTGYAQVQTRQGAGQRQPPSGVQGVARELAGRLELPVVRRNVQRPGAQGTAQQPARRAEVSLELLACQSEAARLDLEVFQAIHGHAGAATAAVGDAQVASGGRARARDGALHVQAGQPIQPRQPGHSCQSSHRAAHPQVVTLGHGVQGSAGPQPALGTEANVQRAPGTTHLCHIRAEGAAGRELPGPVRAIAAAQLHLSALAVAAQQLRTLHLYRAQCVPEVQVTVAAAQLQRRIQIGLECEWL